MLNLIARLTKPIEFLLLIDLDTDRDLTISHQEMEVNGEKLSLRPRNGQSWETAENQSDSRISDFQVE